MKKAIVVKSNEIIESCSQFSLIESKIFAKAVSLIFRKTTEFLPEGYAIQTVEFLKEIEHSSLKFKKRLKEIAKGLARKDLVIRKPNGYHTIILWHSKIDTEQDEIVIKFNEEAKPHLLDLKKLYTKYFLENILPLKSKHAIKIYELCKQYQSQKKRTIDLEKLKKILGIEKKYIEFSKFQKHVLNISKKEINTKTDIFLNFKKIKSGHRITAIEFTIKSQKHIKNIQENTPKETEEDLKIKNLYKKYRKLTTEKKQEIKKKALEEKPFLKNAEEESLVLPYLLKNQEEFF